jgi:hypothetical protein
LNGSQNIYESSENALEHFPNSCALTNDRKGWLFLPSHRRSPVCGDPGEEEATEHCGLGPHLFGKCYKSSSEGPDAAVVSVRQSSGELLLVGQRWSRAPAPSAGWRGRTHSPGAACPSFVWLCSRAVHQFTWSHLDRARRRFLEENKTALGCSGSLHQLENCYKTRELGVYLPQSEMYV